MKVVNFFLFLFPFLFLIIFSFYFFFQTFISSSDYSSNKTSWKSLSSTVPNAKRLDKYFSEIKPVLSRMAQINISTTLEKCNDNKSQLCLDLVNRGVKEIIIDTRTYKISNLLKNLNKKGSKLIANAKKELLALAQPQNEEGGSINSNQINQALKDFLLESYRLTINLTIKDMLDHLWDKRVVAFQINGKSYSITELFTPANQDKTVYFLPFLAKKELTVLANDEINSRDLYQALEDAKLEIYRLSIVQNLNTFQEKEVSKFQINGKTYFFTEFIKPINKNKTVYLLSPLAKTELAALVANAITKTQLDTVLIALFPNSESATKKKEAAQTQKKSEQKKLIIALSAGGGGVLFLSSLGGFLYWFLKVKK